MVKPTPNPPLFTVNPHQDNETLLVNASETLSSLNPPTSNLAFDLDTSQRAIMLGIQQMAELGQLLIDSALEQVSPSPASSNGPNQGPLSSQHHRPMWELACLRYRPVSQHLSS